MSSQRGSQSLTVRIALSWQTTLRKIEIEEKCFPPDDNKNDMRKHVKLSANNYFSLHSSTCLF